ncbi:MAG: thiamine-phosphate kinase [Micromonosporaceae bacterium]|jgi:thiamine-monophosphate kinase
MSITRIGEFGLISRITARLAREAGGTPVTPRGEPRVVLGPGDDAAVLAAPDGRAVVTTDVLVDGRHFRRDWASATEIGRRAAAANLADVAAMGARPTALVVALCVPTDTELAWVEDLAGGMAAEAATVGAGVVGGDISVSPTLTIAVTALGDLEGRAPVTRAGARAGDVVAVAGRLGYAAAGLTILTRGFRSPRLLVDAYRRPRVPYAAGPAAADLGATAMIDVSDGLLADVGHVAAASGVAIDLRRDALTVPDQMRDAAEALGVDPYEWVLTGGDDHALVATFPPGTALPDDWRVIGQAREGSGVTVDGRVHPGPAGWDHLRAPRGT